MISRDIDVFDRPEPEEKRVLAKRSREETLTELRDAIRLDPALAIAAIALATAELDAHRAALRVNLDATIEAYAVAQAEIAQLRRAPKRPWWKGRPQT